MPCRPEIDLATRLAGYLTLPVFLAVRTVDKKLSAEFVPKMAYLSVQPLVRDVIAVKYFYRELEAEGVLTQLCDDPMDA